MAKSKVNVFYIIKNTLFLIFLTILFVLVFQSIKLRTDKDYIPTVFGHTYLNVLSESMTPEFKSKDLIYGRERFEIKAMQPGEKYNARVSMTVKEGLGNNWQATGGEVTANKFLYVSAHQIIN